MVTKNVRSGTKYAKECLDLLRDLSAEQLVLLRGYSS